MRCLTSLRDGRAAAKPHLGPVPAHDGQQHHEHNPRGRPGPRADGLAMASPHPFLLIATQRFVAPLG